MKPGDLDVLINAALHELIEDLDKGENGLDECRAELIKTVTSSQVDMFEKAITHLGGKYHEDVLTDIRGALIREWINWTETMTGRKPENYEQEL